MRSAGQVISRESMTEQALGRKLVPYDRSIDTHISNLRRKLDLEAGKNPEIKNVRGSGYTLTTALPHELERMHSLFLRIFVLFWIAMALIVGGSIAVTFTIAARENESREFQHRPAIAIQASEVLARGGLPALKKWLAANKHSMPDRELYIIGPDGRDILGRRLSDSAARRLEFFNREATPDSDPRRSLSPPEVRAPPGSATPPGGTSQGAEPRLPSGAPPSGAPSAGRRREISARSAPCRRSSRRTARPTRSC